jgi:hypothetical protein
MTIAHKSIKRFFLDGEIYDESTIPRMKEQYIFMLQAMMKSKGYLPRYDIDPDFTIIYNGKTFEFKLSVYGVFVGRKRAEWYDGVDNNRLIINSTQKSKSEESLNPAE